MLETASASTFRAYKSIRTTLLKQACLTSFPCLEPLPKHLETHPFLLAPSPGAVIYFFRPFFRYYILGLVDVSRQPQNITTHQVKYSVLCLSVQEKSDHAPKKLRKPKRQPQIFKTGFSLPIATCSDSNHNPKP